jgi:hypothetical protein
VSTKIAATRCDPAARRAGIPPGDAGCHALHLFGQTGIPERRDVAPIGQSAFGPPRRPWIVLGPVLVRALARLGFCLRSLVMCDLRQALLRPDRRQLDAPDLIELQR